MQNIFRKILHYNLLFLLGITGFGMAGGAIIGASTNAINAWLNPISFYLFIAKTDVISNPRCDSILLGLFEGGMYGLIVGILFAIIAWRTTQFQSSFQFIMKYLLFIVLMIYGCWFIGGVLVAMSSLLRPYFFRNLTADGLSNDLGTKLLSAWGAGSTGGKRIGGLICVIVGSMVFAQTWTIHICQQKLLPFLKRKYFLGSSLLLLWSIFMTGYLYYDGMTLHKQRIAQHQADENRVREQSRMMYQALDGSDRINQIFVVENSYLGHLYPVKGYSLFVYLSGNQENLVDSASWYNPVENGKPKYTWHEFFAVYQHVEDIVSQHQWLHEWKMAGKDRRIEAQISGTTPYIENIEIFVLPPWNHAGIQGIPQYEITLRSEHKQGESRLPTTIFFGDNDQRALIVRSDRDEGFHWLDNIEVFYHPTQEIPEYVVVTPRGEWRIHPSNIQ